MCLGFMLFIAAALFVLGVVLVVRSAESNRETKISFYKDSINEWNDQKRQEFANLNIRVAHNSTTSEAFDEWNDTSQVEVLNHDYYGDLPTYDPLMYHLFDNASDLGFTENYNSFDTSQTTSLEILINDNGVNSTIYLNDVPVMYKESVYHIGARSCTRKGHYYNSEANQWVKYAYLSGFCVKISKDNNGWQLNDTNGGFDWTGSEHHQSPYTYDPIVLQEGETIETHLPLSLRNFRGEVRSAHDPYFTVELLTNSSNDFGIDATTWFALGVTALFISIILAIQPVYLLWRLKTHGPLRFDQLDDTESGRGPFQFNNIEMRSNQFSNQI